MKKIIIILVIIAVAAVGTMYLIDSIKMKNGEEVVFGTWGKKYSTVVKTSQNENIIEEVKYSKTIGDTTIELKIPNGWNYKKMQVAEDDNYDYALKLYKNDEEQYAMIYFYKEKFGVCGTERISKNINLNNGNEVVVGYHSGDGVWRDILIDPNKNIVVINPNLPKKEADEAIEIIKTVNIK
ncbi:MAG: hypothetical protein KHW52_01035 [Clostridium sp.]|jgi:hypothetical protein|nr:hypothetical protein [Clostridium sp.]